MQKKRLFSSPNRKKLIIDNRVYTKNFTGPQASHIIYFYERAYAVAYGAYWIAPIARGNTARNGASPLFWRVYALHTPRVSYGMTEDIKRFDMEIQLLKDIDDASLDRMSVWLYNWWGASENYSLDAVKTYLRHGMQTQHLPVTFGCFEGKRLVGMYQLQWSDLFVRPDLYPWLANVYVDPAYRKCGYGDAMLKSVGAMLKRYTSFRECYLYTTHTSLYEKYGWQFVSEIDTCLPEQRMQRLYRLSIN